MSSGSLFDNCYDALTEESGDKPAKRPKVGRLSGKWTYSESVASPPNGADTGLPGQPISEVVEIEAGLEPAIEEENADPPSGPVGGLNEARANEPANFAVKAHPARSEGTHSPEVEERASLVGDDTLLVPSRDVIVETTNIREGTAIDTTQDLSSEEGSLPSSNQPIYEAQFRQMHTEEFLSVGDPEPSAPHPASTAMPTAYPETAVLPLDKDLWAAPVPPDSPRLRPTASPGPLLISPIMDCVTMYSRVNEEYQDQMSELNPDTEDGGLESQSTPDPVSEVSDQQDQVARRSIEGNPEMNHGEFYHFSPSRYEEDQVLEGRSLNLDRSTISHQKGGDQPNESLGPTDLVQDILDIPNIYAPSPLQNMHSEPPSSVGSASEGELEDDDESSMEDYEGFASDEVSSEDGAKIVEEHKPLGRASSEEEQFWEADSDNEEEDLLVQHESYDWEDANSNKNIEPVPTQGSGVIDLGDNSEDESHPSLSSAEGHTPKEAVSSPVVVSSPSADDSQSSDFDLRPSNADLMVDDEASDYQSYPTLPTEDTEQPPQSYSPDRPDFHDAEAGLDPQRETQLFTPDVSQPAHKERSVSIELKYHNHDLPTPQLTQTTSAGLVSREVASPVQDRALFRNELINLTVPAARGKDDRMRHVPHAISPWFTLKRNSQVYEASEEDDESESESGQSLDSEPQNLSYPVVERSSDIKPYAPAPELETSTTIANGHVIAQSPHPVPSPVGLRTRLSYFSPLATLQDHFASVIDVLATVASTTPIQRSKSGPKDYYLTLNITDPSSDSSYTTVQIFRPFKEALPVVSEGAAILLRNFKVQSQKHRFILVSTASSAWAVFEIGQSVQINGPPVEIGAEERGFAKGLIQWWASLGQDVQGARGDDNDNGNTTRRRAEYGSNGVK